MQKKWIFLTGLLLCLLAGLWAFYNYQKPRSGVQNVQADFTMSSQMLHKAFYDDEAAANARYNGKIIQVHGVVQDVIDKDGAVLILLDGSNGAGGVSCSFPAGESETDWPQAGEEATIKGRCSGYLMDVNIVDAVVIE